MYNSGMGEACGGSSAELPTCGRLRAKCAAIVGSPELGVFFLVHAPDGSRGERTWLVNSWDGGAKAACVGACALWLTVGESWVVKSPVRGGYGLEGGPDACTYPMASRGSGVTCERCGT